jgi:hypothetical protein
MISLRFVPAAAKVARSDAARFQTTFVHDDLSDCRHQVSPSLSPSTTVTRCQTHFTLHNNSAISFCCLQLRQPCACPAVARISHDSSQVMIMRGGGKKNLESFYPTSSGNQTQTVKVSCCSSRLFIPLRSLLWGFPWHAPSSLKTHFSLFISRTRTHPPAPVIRSSLSTADA